MNAHNTMTSPYHSTVRPTQNRGVPFFSCLGSGALVKEKNFLENSDLSNLVDIQRYHGNGK